MEIQHLNNGSLTIPQISKTIPSAAAVTKAIPEVGCPSNSRPTSSEAGEVTEPEEACRWGRLRQSWIGVRTAVMWSTVEGLEGSPHLQGSLQGDEHSQGGVDWVESSCCLPRSKLPAPTSTASPYYPPKYPRDGGEEEAANEAWREAPNQASSQVVISW